MKTHTEQQRLCGSKIYNSANCNNKIRKVAQNRYENVYLCGKHAFNYSVIIENKTNKQIKETIFPDRKSATVFFAQAVKVYE